MPGFASITVQALHAAQRPPSRGPMMSRLIDLCIRGGTLYDPANGVDGVPADLWIDGGKMVAPPDPGVKAAKVLDARGYVVFPGGVDMHTHLVGPKVNAARAKGK